MGIILLFRNDVVWDNIVSCGLCSIGMILLYWENFLQGRQCFAIMMSYRNNVTVRGKCCCTGVMLLYKCDFVVKR